MQFSPRRILSTAMLVTMLAMTAPAVADAPQMLIEIFRIAPGQHTEFLRHLAAYDQANIGAGIPPRQLFVHQSGAGWDFLILQPAGYSDEVNAKLDAATKRLGLPQGGKYFVEIRKLMTDHTDTIVDGPTTAADWLKKLD